MRTFRNAVLCLGLLGASGVARGASLIACADGNFTSASTWCLVDSTSYLDTHASTVTVGTSNVDSQSFTPGNITVDGIAVKVNSRYSSPGANTFTVTLRDVTTSSNVASVTINVSDILSGMSGTWFGWYFVKFSSPVSLGTDTYLVRVVASASSMVTLYRDGTANNICRMLRTTTTQAPAANDQLHVLGEWTAPATKTSRTVTMDNNSSTSFGPTVSGGPPEGMTVGVGGTLDWARASATKLVLKGLLYVKLGGTMNIGVSGSPVTATAEYQMDSVANVDSGMWVAGTLNIYGPSLATTQTVLTADVSSGTAVLSVGSTSGWSAGDSLGIASTTRTWSQCEQKMIQSVDSGTQVTLTTNLSYAHGGTAPVVAEVVHLTRSVKIHGASSSLQGYILFTESSVANVEYAEFYYLGSNNSNQRGIDAYTRPDYSGSLRIEYSSLHDFVVAGSTGLMTHGGLFNNLTFRHNVDYGVYQQLVYLDNTTNSAWDISYNTAMSAQSSAQGMFRLGGLAGVFTHNTAAGSAAYGFYLDTSSAVGSFSDNTAHSCGLYGLQINSAPAQGSVLSRVSIWRNNTKGMILPTLQDVTFEDFTMFGNLDANIWFGTSASYNVVFSGLVSNGDTSFSTTTGIAWNGDVANRNYRTYVLNSRFSQVSGILTAHSYDYNVNANISNNARVQLWSNGSSYGAPTLIAGLGAGTCDKYTEFHFQGMAPGDHRSYYVHGSSRTDSTVFHTAAPSERLSPASTSIKLQSSPKQAAVAAGNTVTWSVWVYKSASYTGAQPRLVLRANPSIGVNADTVLATASGGTGVWEQLTGVTPAASGDDGVFEAFVDCGGTAGSVYVDDWAAGGVLISENRAWWNGASYQVAGGQPIGGQTYWSSGLAAEGFPPGGPPPSTPAPPINNPILASQRREVPRP